MGMTMTRTDLMAIEALNAIAAHQETAPPTEESRLGRFYADRIAHYETRGVSNAQARLLAREDRIAQF